MSNSTQPDLFESHHYPPTTADWATSPLAQQDELLHNPLEAPPPSVNPLLRLGALLVIGGGLLALAGSFLQFVQMHHLLNWYLWLVLLTSVLAVGMLAGSLILLYRVTSQTTTRVIFFACATIAAELVAVGVTLTAADARVGLAGGVWVSVGSTLFLLVGGGILRFVGRPQVSGQELAEQAENDERVWNYTRGDKFLGGWRGYWNPPRTGD